MPLHLEIVTPEKQAFEGDVDEVIVPGSEGEMGILPHHAPLISALGQGRLRLRLAVDRQRLDQFRQPYPSRSVEGATEEERDRSAHEALRQIGLPAIIWPSSYIGVGIVETEGAYWERVDTGLRISPIHQVTVALSMKEQFAIFGGFLQVRPDRVVVLAEMADLASEIDLERAERARREAQRVLEGGFVEPADLALARAALQRALIRIRLAERGARRPTGEHEAARRRKEAHRQEPPGGE